MNSVHAIASDGDPVCFSGKEIKKTRHWGQNTLAVTGKESADAIQSQAEQVGATHIYIGADRSFRACTEWKEVITQLLDSGYEVTLDYPVWQHYDVEQAMGDVMLHPRLTPLISVEIPYAARLNPNTTIKIDDVDGGHTNPGIWCHSLTDLLCEETFTPWNQYGEDTVL